VLGGPVDEDNVYIKVYPVRLKGEKPLQQLEVGESSFCRYNLSMQDPAVYRVTRVS
jgi:hypothetical protein